MMADRRAPKRPALAIPLVHRISGRDNNLNLIRMLAAFCVMVSHSFPVTRGFGADEPLKAATGSTLGYYAVAVFFGISGFLISRSYARRASLWHWLFARFLRLFPGLFVMLALCVLVLGPSVTALPLPQYFSDAATWTYLPRNLSLAFIQNPLPGVFSDQPFGHTLNGSLWTLFHEVLCYAGVLVAGMIGLLERRRTFALVLVIVLLGYLAGRFAPIDQETTIGLRFVTFTRLAFPFALGVALFVYRRRVRLDWRIAAGLWLLVLLASGTPFVAEVLVVAICYSTLCLAYVPRGALLKYNQLGDYSYGTYIYAFPMQHLAFYLLPGQHWTTNLLLAVPMTLVLAVLSWKLIERPSLALVGSAAERMVTLRAPRLIENR